MKPGIKKFFAIIAIVCVSAFGFQAVQASAEFQPETPIELFTPTGETPERAQLQSSEGVLDSIIVNFDTLVFENVARNAAANLSESQYGLLLPAEKHVLVSFSPAEFSDPQRFVISGIIPAESFGEVTLSLFEGTLWGSVVTQDAIYRVRGIDANLAVIEQLDPAIFKDEIWLEVPDEISTADLDKPLDDNGVRLAGDDDGTRIDLLVAYTSTARTSVGGTTTAMNAFINTMIAETNQGYANSQVTQRVNLVHAVEVAYNESGFEWHTALNRLQNGTDGYMDDAVTLRNTYAADEVMLLVGNTASCGIAWLMTSPSTSFENWAFSVVSTNCAVGYYSAGHEMGHNMGLHHDIANATGSQGAYPYSYGYQHPNQLFRTIMAYNCPNGGCPRLNYYSNPNVYLNYGGVMHATGTANANNALTLNNTAIYVANFRDGVAPAAPGDLAATQLSSSQVQLTWQDLSNDEYGFYIERRLAGTGTWAQIGSTAANSTSYTDATTTGGTAYDYRIKAQSPNGVSYSATVTISVLRAPYNLQSIPYAQSHIRFTWQDSNNNESGFQIERRPNAGGSWALIATVGANTTEYVNSGLNCGSKYDYRIRAVNNLGVSSYVELINAQTFLCNPVNLQGTTPSAFQVNLTWTDNNQNENGTQIERRLQAGGTWQQIAAVDANITSYTDGTAVCSTAYQYRIRFYNDFNESAYVTPSLSITTSACTVLPDPPIQLTALPAWVDAISLNWVDAAYETQYEIERSTDQVNWQVVAVVSGNQVTYTDIGLVTGQVYYYRVRAYNPLGYSPYTNIASANSFTEMLFVPAIIH